MSAETACSELIKGIPTVDVQFDEDIVVRKPGQAHNEFVDTIISGGERLLEYDYAKWLLNVEGFLEQMIQAQTKKQRSTTDTEIIESQKYYVSQRGWRAPDISRADFPDSVNHAIVEGADPDLYHIDGYLILSMRPSFRRTVGSPKVARNYPMYINPIWLTEAFTSDTRISDSSANALGGIYIETNNEFSPIVDNLTIYDIRMEDEDYFAPAVGVGVGVKDAFLDPIKTAVDGATDDTTAQLFGAAFTAISLGFISDAKLRKNQPFTFEYGLTVFDDKLISTMKRANIVEVPNFELNWGLGKTALKLILRYDGSAELFSASSGDMISLGRKALPIKAIGETYKKFKLVIYPIGNKIYIGGCEGVDLPSSLSKNEAARWISFEFSRNLSIEESEVSITSFSKKSYFSFSPVTHCRVGYMQSPLVNYTEGDGGLEKLLYVLDYVGKFGMGPSPAVGMDVNGDDQTITFPHAEDFGLEGVANNEPQFNYLLNCQIIKMIIPQGGANFFSYVVGLKSELAETYNDGQAPLGDEFNYKNVVSPAFSAVKLMQLMKEIQFSLRMGDINDTINSDVEGVSINSSLEGVSGTMTLNNRNYVDEEAVKGRYTHIDGQDGFCGVKPLTIRVGIDGSEFVERSGGPLVDSVVKFRGYMVPRQYNRDSSTSKVTVNLEDMSKKAKEQYTFNLPIYDGWCHFAAMYDLLHRAGYSDDEMVLWQHGEGAGEKRTLAEEITKGGGNVETRVGGCFDGHIHPGELEGLSWSSGSAIVSSRDRHIRGPVFHAPLPLPAIKEQPKFMFQMGSPYWDCMRQIAEYNQWFLYANQYGSIVYQPGPVAFQRSGSSITDLFKFTDVPTFYEKGVLLNEEMFRSALNVSIDNKEVRNAVQTWGLVELGSVAKADYNVTPYIVMKVQAGWPRDVTKEDTFVPWLALTLIKNPMFNEPRRIKLYNDELFRRSNRVRMMASWTSWGRPDLFPFRIVRLMESNTDHEDNQTNVNDKLFIISSVNETINAGALEYNISYEGEYYDPASYNFMPQVDY